MKERGPDQLLHPNLFRGGLPIIGAAMGALLRRQISERAAAIDAMDTPNMRVGVAIQLQPRVMPWRTGNDVNKMVRPSFDRAAYDVRRLTKDLAKQSMNPHAVVALVPHGTVLTGSQEQWLKGVDVVHLDEGASHADVLNTAAEALDDRGVDIVGITESGAHLATRQAIKAAAIRLHNPSLTSVYGLRLPGEEATTAEARIFGQAAFVRASRLRFGDKIPELPKDHAGFWRIEDVLATPFSAEYGNGGADTRAAGTSRLEIATSVHWSERLDALDIARQRQDWRSFEVPNFFVSPATVPPMEVNRVASVSTPQLP